ncbi:sensor histidine kinase [Nonomuraea pusilla]|uniref:histidine kinase n=1 Tax=Nonomuraea pusilla TaxID=46177 RepID=A0A1H8GQS9_9ACTN|nr:histidine kinase [Nonomuraea pusilla]SEN46372.1 Signal transduction histidine kinase [Nonomuraea pusilla]
MGVLAGAVLGVVELVFLCVAGPVRLIPATRPTCDRIAERLLSLERLRLARWLGHRTVPAGGGYGFLAVRAVVGLVAGFGVAEGLFFSGLLLFGGLWDLLTGESESVPIDLPGVNVISNAGVVGLLTGGFLLGLTLAGMLAAGAAEGRLADRLLGPSSQERIRRRIAELTATRSDIVRAVDEERRRIERDLHDGVQQRGIALAMLLGRAQHAADPAKAGELVAQAYTESRELLDELRSVAWRIYPTALDELGLRAALAGVAEQSSVPVTIRYGLVERPVSEIETALYFVVREAISNAIKHAGARDILVVMEEHEQVVSVAVSDDGAGGADPSGGGLSGLARRVRALDGVFTVDSPPGGPTRIAATLPKEVPCG